MHGDRTRTIRFALALIALSMAPWCPRALAGPGTYDPATRTFNLTYTYAIVPSAGMMGDQLEQLGLVKPATPDQDAKVRAYFAAVSDKLWQATNQRGKIGTFNCVDNLKQADVIVSPTGKIGRGGYATPGGFEDRQGHLVISYEDLTVSGKDIDAQLTIFHELCHYLFALPDEYRDGEAVGLCPQQNASGPGCLMDNYWFDGPRHGWYGRFCNGDHNANAPLPQTIITGQTAQQACAQLIDLFFQSHLKGAAAANPPSSDGSTGGATATGDGAGATGSAAATGDGAGADPTPADPFTGIFDALVDATGSFLRNLIQGSKDSGKPAPAAGALRSAADKFLREQVAFGKQTSNMTPPTADQVKRGVEMAVQTAQKSRVGVPQRFSKTAVGQLLQKAKEIAAKELGKPGGSSLTVSPLTSTPTARTRATSNLGRKIETELLTFARSALGISGSGLSGLAAFSPEEKAYIKQVSTDAAAQATNNDSSPLGTYFAAAKVHIKISQIIARSSLDTRDELGLPGTDIFRDSLSAADRDLVKLALPGNPFQGFGLRRTVIFAPMPVDPANDRMRLQASPASSYAVVRSLGLAEIRALITREKMIVLPEDMSPPMTLDVKNLDRSERLRMVLQQINFLTDQVRRNRFDNIIVIVPPGGLPEDLGDQLESLRKRMALNPDVRLDIVQVDTGNVPRRLRDLCARSRGSSLLAFDIDSFGAVAQRLRGEGLSGSLVIIPEQGRIDLTPGAAAQAAAPADPTLSPRSLPVRFRRTRLEIFNNYEPARDAAPNAKSKVAAAADELVPEFKSRTSPDPSRADVYYNAYPSDLFPESALPSLAQLRNALLSLGVSNNVLEQEDIKNNVAPMILKLDALRQHLDELISALKGLGPKDRSSIEKAFQFTVQAKRDLAIFVGYPVSGLTSAEDAFYQSWRMRELLEQSILQKIRRFDSSRSEYLDLVKKASGSDIALRPPLKDLVAAEKDFQAYGELSRLFSSLFLNLRQYDTIRRSATPNAEDPVAMLEGRLEGACLGRLDVPDLRAGAYALKPAADSTSTSGGAAPAKGALENATKDQSGDKRTEPPKSKAGAGATGAKQAESPPGAAKPPAKPDDGSSAQKPSEAPPSAGGAGATGAKAKVNPPGEAKPPAKPGDGTSTPNPTDAQTRAGGAGAADSKSMSSQRGTATAGGAQRKLDKPGAAAYLQLLAEIYVDLFDMQHELSRGASIVGASARLPRATTSIVPMPAKIADAPATATAGGVIAELLAPVAKQPEPGPFDLKPFTAEEKASFDLIIGFSRELKLDEIKQDPPDFKLFNKAGAGASEVGAPFLQLDAEKSTPTMLVYRLPNPDRDAGRILSGDYYPKLSLKQKHLPDRGSQIDYTFSVASASPKVLLTATLRQIAIRASDGDEENDDEVAARGIISLSKSVAIVEAMVTAGSPVQNVTVTGFYQKVEVNGGSVTSPALTFLDDGKWPDTTAGDGVYTAKITLDPQEKRKQADYRVLIEARSNDKTSYVPTETFTKPAATAANSPTTKTAKAKAPAPPVDDQPTPSPPKFQRATSVDFMVEGAGGTS
jgi:hypothetical protein